MSFLSGKNKLHPLIRASLAPLIFEMCGTIPLILVLLGIINVSAGISLRNTLVYQYGPVFFAVAAIFFGFGIVSFLKQKNSCSLSGVKKYQKFIIFSFLLLSAVEAVLLLFLQITEKIIYGVSLSFFYEFFGFAVFLVSVLLLFIVIVRFIK